jgi:penicillin-binding protein 1A
MTVALRLLRWFLAAALAGLTLGLAAIGVAYLYLAPSLPSVDALREVQLQVPLRVYTRDGALMAEYGEQRRDPLPIEDTPLPLRQAFLAAEDDRFYSHPGVDYQGVLRAAWNLAVTGEKTQGASTITMQVARNFFLSREKTYTRKLREIFLALRIERELSKDEIFELYLNKIYLGNRAYGVAAAARVYYGRELAELDLPQLAMIAGLPKAPSRFNPVVNPERALQRRDYVLSRMHQIGFLDDERFAEARAAPITARLYSPRVEVEAPYLGEMVRRELFEAFGEEAYTRGLQAYTTVDARMQRKAVEALRANLIAYDLRHGYRGPEAQVELPEAREPAEAEPVASGFVGLAPLDLDPLLSDYRIVGGLWPGLVLTVEDTRAEVYLGAGQTVELAFEQARWARAYVNENVQGPEPERLTEILAPGDIIRLAREELPPEDVSVDEAQDAASGAEEPSAEPEGPRIVWSLRQLPEVEGALVSLDPQTGAIRALAGGFDFFQSKFNRATQAERQPGSAFKPFVYSGALEKGYTPASIINDAPVVFEDPALEAAWRPENYSGRFYGPTRLRVALTHSRNLVSIRLLRAIGVPYTHRYVRRFGFDTGRLPRDLSLALGSGTLTPLELTQGFSVFANGGYQVTPYLIERVEDENGRVLRVTGPTELCEPPCASEGEDAPEDAAADAAEAAVQPEELMAEAAESVPADAPPADAGADAAPDAEAPPPDAVPEPRYAPRVLPASNAYQIASMLRDVVEDGTGRRARALGRTDIAGKTGTTNDQNDAWFAGFTPALATTAWVGFDRLRPLGAGETGAGAALPMWVDFMATALEGVPMADYPQPEGMVTVRIDPESGLLADADNPVALFETFRAENAPTRMEPGRAGAQTASGSPSGIPEQLF